MPTAKIRFTQNGVVGTPSKCFFGQTGIPVTVDNGGSNTGAVRIVFTVLWSPLASEIARGVAQDSSGEPPPETTWTFTPDSSNGYTIQLDLYDEDGNRTTDVKQFGVQKTSGRFIPGWTSPGGIALDAAADPLWLNYGTNTYEWAPFIEPWLEEVEALSTAFGATFTVGQGGTGVTTLAAHGLVVGRGTAAVATIAPGGAGLPLLGAGSGADPAFGALSLSGAGVTGTLPVGSGGTGATTFTAHAVLVGEGTGAIVAVGPGTAGLPLLGAGGGADPAFGALNLAGAGVTGSLGVANGGTGVATFAAHAVLVGNGAGAIVAVGPGTAGLPLLGAGGAADPSFGALNLAGAGVTGTLAVGNGGTGAATFTAHGVLIGEGAAAFVSVPLASGKILIGQGAADPAAQSVSGDGTLSAAGVLTISGLQGVTLPAPATGYLLFGQGSGLSWNGPLSQPTATAFYIDPAGGSDAAAGTSLAPLKTFREAVGRIGSFRPAFPSSATVTFHILSSQTDLSDPIVWSPVSGNTVFVGTPILQATSALANVSYSAGGVVTATIAGASLGDMVVNNAKGGVAFVGNVVGSTCTLSVPSASNVPFSTAAPAAVLNWANGDSYSRYTLPQVYAPNVGCDITSAYTANIQLQHLNVGITGHSYMATGTVGMLECAVTTPYTSSTVFFDTRGGSFINCFVSGQLQFGGGYFYAGALYNAAGNASAIVIERVAIAGGALLCGNGGMYLELSEVSSLNVASTNPNINLIGNNNFGSGSPSTIYGTYTLNLASGLTGESIGCLTYFGTAAATFLGNPTFTFGAGSQAGAVSFGNALDVGTGVAQWYPHRALNVTNLDLAVALGGFGGRAFSDFGSFITNGTQGTTAPGTLATTDWYINAATGSDANAGTSSGAPLATWHRLSQILGPQPWNFTTGTVNVHFTADHTSLTDPVVVDATFANSAVLNLFGNVTTLASGTITGLTAKTIGNPGNLLSINLPGGTGARGNAVLNATRGSIAIIEAVTAGVATLSQPLTTFNLTTGAGAIQDDTWGNGDAISVLSLGKINLVAARARTADFDTSFTPFRVYRATICDPQYTGSQSFNRCTTEGYVTVLESFVQRALYMQHLGGTPSLVNVGVTSGLYSGTWSGVKASNVFVTGGFIGPESRIAGVQYTGGVIIENSTSTQAMNGGILSGEIYLAASGGGLHTYGDVLIAAGPIWGPGFLNVSGGQTRWNSGLVATAIFKCSGILIDNVANAYTYDFTLDPAPLHGNRTVLISALDTAVSAGGFGSRVYGYGGTFLGLYAAAGPATSAAVTGVASGGTGATTFTAHAVLVGEGTGAIVAVGPGTAGLPLLGAGGAADPAFGALNLAGSGITGTLGAANGGTGAATLTAHAVLVGNGTGAIAAVGPGTSGLPLLGAGAGANPAFGALALNSAAVSGSLAVGNGGTGAATFTAHGVLIGEGTGAVVSVGPGAAGLPLLGAGGGADPAFGALSLSGSGVTGTLPVTSGGTGLATITAHALLVGEGTGNVGLVGPSTAGLPLIAAGAGADPAFGALNLAGAGVTGTLPAANLPTITLTGDTTGSGAGGSIATTTVALSGAGGTLPIASTAGTFSWAAAAAAVTLTQATLASASSGAPANGKSWTIQAQAGQALTGGTGPTQGGAGGNVFINAGAGGNGFEAPPGGGGNVFVNGGSGFEPGGVSLQSSGTTFVQVQFFGLFFPQLATATTQMLTVGAGGLVSSQAIVTEHILDVTSGLTSMVVPAGVTVMTCTGWGGGGGGSNGAAGTAGNGPGAGGGGGGAGSWAHTKTFAVVAGHTISMVAGTGGGGGAPGGPGGITIISDVTASTTLAIFPGAASGYFGAPGSTYVASGGFTTTQRGSFDGVQFVPGTQLFLVAPGQGGWGGLGTTTGVSAQAASPGMDDAFFGWEGGRAGGQGTASGASQGGGGGGGGGAGPGGNGGDGGTGGVGEDSHLGGQPGFAGGSAADHSGAGGGGGGGGGNGAEGPVGAAGAAGSGGSGYWQLRWVA